MIKTVIRGKELRAHLGPLMWRLPIPKDEEMKPAEVIEHDFTQNKPDIENVPEFSRRGLRKTCIHNRLFYDEKNRRLECKDCGNDVEPFTVLLRYMRYDWRLDSRVMAIKHAEAEEERRKKQHLRWPASELKRDIAVAQMRKEHENTEHPRRFMWLTSTKIWCYCGENWRRKHHPGIEAEVKTARQLMPLYPVRAV